MGYQKSPIKEAVSETNAYLDKQRSTDDFILYDILNGKASFIE